MRRFLFTSLALAAILGVPMLILQRWIAETRFAALVLVAAWLVLVGVAVAVLALRRPQLRAPLLGTYAAILLGTLAIGYLTGFRDMRVDEDVVMASTRAGDAERAAVLSGEAQTVKPKRPAPPEPVEVARGSFVGADGHAGSGAATIVAVDGERTLTFTRFDVDPGVDVDVFLSSDPEDVSDRVELGDLKGNVGDQEYEIPAGVDLERYANVVLWCNPFTVRIAVAELGA